MEIHMLRRFLLAAGFVAMAAAPAAAQIPFVDGRLGMQVTFPTEDLADAYDTGFGVYGRIGLPMGMFKLMGTASLTRMPGKSTILGDIDDETVLSMSVGPHLSVPLVDVGVE